MTNKEILENNKLVSKFACIKNSDGTIHSNTQGGYPKGTMHFNLSRCPINTMYPFDHVYAYINAGEWNRNWHWLMPVVERIKFIDDNQEMFFEDYYRIDLKCDFLHGVELWVDKDRIFLQTAFGEDTLIDAVYGAVIEFIKWFNKHKKQ